MWAEAVDGGDRRVVVTGLGVVSPIGTGTERFWRAALDGRLGTRRLSRFDTSELSSDKGGPVEDFEPRRFVRRLDLDDLSRCAQFAIAVTRMALDSAGLTDLCAGSERSGVSMGIVHGNRPVVEPLLTGLRQRGDRPCDPSPPSYLDAAARVGRLAAEELDLRGPNLVSSTACAAGNGAITHAFKTICTGAADVMVAGGCDELSYATFIMFNSFRALAPEVVRPFDRHRQGLIVSEGAAALVLESYEQARRRGATLYAEVLGHGNFSDAHHMTAPHPGGLGAVRSMHAALKTARLAPEDVDHINAHGTATLANDLIEARAIRQVFGRHADTLPVSALKSMIGHTQGAASAIEAVSCVLAIRDGVIPPTINVEELDPECDIDLVTGEARQLPVRVVMNNSFGFGGNVSCVLFGSAT